MSEHTPGPWKVDSKYCVGPVSQEDDQSYGMIIPVADVYGPNIQADAELIASAPQLREQNRVLREALQEIASDIKGNPKRKQMLADDDFWAAPGEHTLRQWIAKAALTATSQEGQHESR